MHLQVHVHAAQQRARVEDGQLVVGVAGGGQHAGRLQVVTSGGSPVARGRFLTCIDLVPVTGRGQRLQRCASQRMLASQANGKMQHNEDSLVGGVQTILAKQVSAQCMHAQAHTWRGRQGR